MFPSIVVTSLMSSSEMVAPPDDGPGPLEVLQQFKVPLVTIYKVL